MKTPNWMMGLCAVVAAVQLSVPASLIVRHERTLHQGTAWKFKTAPVDPYDAFRGRYVALQFEQSQAAPAADQTFRRGQKVFVALEKDKDGFARFATLSAEPPKDKPYLRVRAGWQSGPTVQVELPFDRFYMGEHIAPAAEQAYWQNNRRGQTNTTTYAMVRIRDGRAVIENVFIGDKPIRQVAKEQTRN
jgi:uncharacterized membrane-anchored protein